MPVVTLGRLAQEIQRLLSGGSDSQSSSSVSLNEIKISIGQVVNTLLKTEHFTVNEKMGEKIPNGTVLGWYENIQVISWNGKSKCTLPIKPLKLPRNMGLAHIYPKYTTNGNYELDKEFVPLQMGEGSLIQGQRLVNTILGKDGYENFGMDCVFTRDIKTLFPQVVVAMRLAVMDVSQLGDYDTLPILPEQEWTVKQEVVKMYSGEEVADMLVDPTTKQQQNVPIVNQRQST